MDHVRVILLQSAVQQVPRVSLCTRCSRLGFSVHFDFLREKSSASNLNAETVPQLGSWCFKTENLLALSFSELLRNPGRTASFIKQSASS